MNKTELVDAIARRADVTKVKAKEVLDALLEEITQSLSRNQEVTLTGFGTFKVSARKARTGRNPQTGAPLHIPAMKIPRFKAGKALKDAVR